MWRDTHVKSLSVLQTSALVSQWKEVQVHSHCPSTFSSSISCFLFISFKVWSFHPELISLYLWLQSFLTNTQIFSSIYHFKKLVYTFQKTMEGRGGGGMAVCVYCRLSSGIAGRG
jgi:hypothetical protein